MPGSRSDKRRQDRQQAGRARAQLRAQLVGRAGRRVGGQRLRERLRGRGRPVVAAAVEDDAALLARIRGELRGQARLPHPGLPGHEHAAAAAVARVAPGSAQGGDRRLAPREVDGPLESERGRERDLDGAAERPAHAPGAHRVHEAPQRQLAGVLQRFPCRAPGEQAHRVRGQDLAGTRRGAEPLRLDDRGPEDVVGLPRHVAGTDAHAHGDRHRSAVRLPVDRALDVPGAGDRGAGRVEHGQEPVPECLDLPAVVRGDHVAHPAIVLAAHRVGFLVAQLGPQPRGTHDVGEQDGRGRHDGVRRRRLGSGGGPRSSAGSCARMARSQALELRPRAQPQLGVERPNRLAVGRERIALAPRPIEGEHELAAEALAEWVTGHQRLELGHQLAVTPGEEIGLDPILERGGVQRLQRHDLGLRERLERDVGERWAAPLRERGAQTSRSAIGRRPRRARADPRRTAPRSDRGPAPPARRAAGSPAGS